MNSQFDHEFDAARQFVRTYLASRGIEFRFDHSICLAGQVQRANTPDEVEEVLKTPFPTIDDLQDRLILAAAKADITPRAVKVALRLELREQRQQRYATVWKELQNEKQLHDKAISEHEWDRLNGLFTTGNDLPKQVLKSFVWGTKRKALNQPVTRHLMPIVFSREQGTGKTEFVRRFTGPLQELCADGVLFSDLADRRSGDIFRYCVVIIDDMEQIPRSSVPILKTVLTAKSMRRRTLGTSMTDAIRQQCMPIGTSNQPVEELVQDTSGNRRFVLLPWRNGDVVKGGDPDVWEIVNELDYKLLWQSVDPFADNPINSHLDILRGYQSRYSHDTTLLKWLRSIDFDSEDLRNARTRGGYYSARLRQLLFRDTGYDLGQLRFAKVMEALFPNEGSPFQGKDRDDGGVFYIVKPPKPENQ
jgi:hypothetical protein